MLSVVICPSFFFFLPCAHLSAVVDADVEPVVAESVEMFRSPCELLNGSYTGVRLKRITREAELRIYLFCVQFLDVSHPKLYFQPHSRLFFFSRFVCTVTGQCGYFI